MDSLRIKYNNLALPIRASIWFLVCSFLQKGISVITTPIFTRLMTSSEYGQYSVFNSWYGIATVFIGLNLYSGVFAQGLVKFEEDRHKFISALQGLTMFLIIIWLAIYLLLESFWNKLLGLNTIQMLSMISLIWTTSIFNYWALEQRVNYAYKPLVILTVVVAFLKPIIGIIGVTICSDKVTARVVGVALVEIVAFFGLLVRQIKKENKVINLKYWKYALAFNIPLIPHYLSMTVLNSADRIMISSMCGSDKAGIYSVAYSISQVMTLFNMALLQTIEPWMYKTIKNKNIQNISRVAYPTFIFIATINILLIAFSPEIIKIFAPSEYYDAIWVIPPIAVSVFFMFSYSFFAVFEFYYEKTVYIAIASTIGAILNIILNYYFIGLFGFYAAGYTTLFCYMFFSAFHYLFMRKIIKLYLDNVKVYSVGVLLSIVMLLVVVSLLLLFTYNNNPMRYLIICLVFGILLLKYKRIKDFILRIIEIRKDK